MFLKIVLKVQYQNYKCFGEKKGIGQIFTWSNKAWYMGMCVYFSQGLDPPIQPTAPMCPSTMNPSEQSIGTNVISI